MQKAFTEVKMNAMICLLVSKNDAHSYTRKRGCENRISTVHAVAFYSQLNFFRDVLTSNHGTASLDVGPT